MVYKNMFSKADWYKITVISKPKTVCGSVCGLEFSREAGCSRRIKGEVGAVKLV